MPSVWTGTGRSAVMTSCGRTSRPDPGLCRPSIGLSAWRLASGVVVTAEDAGLTPESQILALRWVLATARQDRDVMKLVAAELSQQHPFTTAAELACLTASFAGALSALGFVQAFSDDPDFRSRSRDHDGAVEVIELWMQAILDKLEDDATRG